MLLSCNHKWNAITSSTSLSGEGNVNGFGLEFFIETPSDEIADSTDDIKRSWQFQLLYTVSQLAAGMQLPRLFSYSTNRLLDSLIAACIRATVCAGHGSIRSILDDMKLLSTEAEGVNVAIPEADRPTLVNSAGRVGALLGLTPSETGRQLHESCLSQA